MLGVPTGPLFGHWVLDVDIDPEKGIDGSLGLAALEEQHGALPLTAKVRTPRGGRHIYFRYLEGFHLGNHSGRLPDGIDVRGDGGYVIVPPSVRRDGTAYEWVYPLEATVAAPEWLLSIIRNRPQPTLKRGAGADPRHSGTGLIVDKCRELAAVTVGGRNQALNRASFELGTAGINPELATETLLEACRTNGLVDDDGEKRVTDTIVRALADGCASRAADWRSKLHRGRTGGPIGNHANMLIALREAPELVGLFGFDEMKQRTVFVRPVEGGEAFDTPCEVTDREVLQVLEWAQNQGIPHMTKGVVQDAIEQASREWSFHPLRAWLTNLSWDGRERLKDLFPVYLGAERSPYAEAIGRMFPIAMVARVMRPGCKADYMPILEGEQGAEKSKVGKVLAGPWFSDHLPDIRNDQASAQHLAGKWLIEVAEMDSFSKAEATRYKAFVTRETDRYRPPYARHEIEQPRQCVFFGTTNEDEYLRDTTGGRRFWPVRVGKISISDLERDREQLFAEAVKRFQEEEEWWPDPDFEAKYFRPEQERRSLPDPWADQVQDIVSDQDRVFVGETLTALGISLKDQGTAAQRRVSTILKKLGWESGSPSRGKTPYVRTNRAAPKQEPPM